MILRGLQRFLIIRLSIRRADWRLGLGELEKFGLHTAIIAAGVSIRLRSDDEITRLSGLSNRERVD